LYGVVGKVKDTTGRLKQKLAAFRSSLDLSAFAKGPASRISRAPAIRCATKMNSENERSGVKSTLLKAAAPPQCSGTNWRRRSSRLQRVTQGDIRGARGSDPHGTMCVVKCVVKLAQSWFLVSIEFEEFAGFYGQKLNILPVKSAWEISESCLWSQSIKSLADNDSSTGQSAKNRKTRKCVVKRVVTALLFAAEPEELLIRGPREGQVIQVTGNRG